MDKNSKAIDLRIKDTHTLQQRKAVSKELLNRTRNYKNWQTDINEQRHTCYSPSGVFFVYIVTNMMSQETKSYYRNCDPNNIMIIETSYKIQAHCITKKNS